MEKKKNDILKALKKHKKLTRKELSSTTGLSDRVCRHAIAELRDEGYMIGITASGGYSINNKTDFRRAIAFYTAKTRKEEARIRSMKKTLENVNQLRMSL